eukprot:Clim_evm19s229 gene=Clim_evmTU19s229
MATAKPPIVAAAAADTLATFSSLVNSTTDDQFVAPSNLIKGSTVGKHLRHCLDHYDKIIAQLSEAKQQEADGLLSAEGKRRKLTSEPVEYDRRRRETDIESSRESALEAIRRIQGLFQDVKDEDLDLEVTVRAMITADGTENDLRSTVARELHFVNHHAIHHAAMMKVVAAEHGVELPSSFGLAPSTRNYQSKQAEHQAGPLQTTWRSGLTEADVGTAALDIGGSLCKCVWLDRKNDPLVPHQPHDANHTNGDAADNAPEIPLESGEELVFRTRQFHTSAIGSVLDWMKYYSLRMVRCTGGGSVKFTEELTNSGVLGDGLTVNKCRKDELGSVVLGINYLLRNNPEAFLMANPETGEFDQKPFMTAKETTSGVFPYLVMIVGSGLSVLRVDDEKTFERVTGSCIGGGTAWGMAKLITGADSFNQALQMSAKGDHKNVDLVVGDIYGRGYEAAGLNPDILASSLGKIATGKVQPHDCRPADLAASIITMIGYNFGHIAYLTARVNTIRNVIFVGSYLHQNPASRAAASFGVSFWAKGHIKPVFVDTDSYLGALGAYLTKDE